MKCRVCEHAARARVCHYCKRREPKGRWPKGAKLWAWRLCVGCEAYKIVRRLYHFAPGDDSPCAWLVDGPVKDGWRARWRVPPGGGLDALDAQGLLVPSGTETGYWRAPDGYGYRLKGAA